jgi:hypothetical protein
MEKLLASIAVLFATAASAAPIANLVCHRIIIDIHRSIVERSEHCDTSVRAMFSLSTEGKASPSLSSQMSDDKANGTSTADGPIKHCPTMPYLDATCYGVRPSYAFDIPNVPGIEATINVTSPCSGSGTANRTACLSNASGFQVGDGVAIFNAGATNPTSTPLAPIIAPSVAVAPTGTLLVTNSPTGSTDYAYYIAEIAPSGAITALSPAAIISSGLASLGPQPTALSSITASNDVYHFVTLSPQYLAVGAVVHVYGATPNQFNGYWRVTARNDSTHFTAKTMYDTRNGSATIASVPGMFNYWLSNHITWRNVQGSMDGTKTAIYRGVPGGAVLVGVSDPQNSNFVGDRTQNAFDDYGTTYSVPGHYPYYIPSFVGTLTLSSATENNSRTASIYTCSAPCNVDTGQRVTIEGFSDSRFNVSGYATFISQTQFSLFNSLPPANTTSRHGTVTQELQLPTNGILSTTIVAINGNTIALSDAATNNITRQTMLFDNGPTYAAAVAAGKAANTRTVLPPAPSGQSYIFNSPTILADSCEIEWSHGVLLNDTLTAPDCTIWGLQIPSGSKMQFNKNRPPDVSVQRGTIGLYSGPNADLHLHFLNFVNSNTNNTTDIFVDRSGSGYLEFDRVNGSQSGYTSIAIHCRGHHTAGGAFYSDFKSNNLLGSQLGFGSMSTPSLYSDNGGCGSIDSDGMSLSGSGIVSRSPTSGGQSTFRNIYSQANHMPFYTHFVDLGNTVESLLFEFPTYDTTFAPLVVGLGDSTLTKVIGGYVAGYGRVVSGTGVVLSADIAGLDPNLLGTNTNSETSVNNTSVSDGVFGRRNIGMRSVNSSTSIGTAFSLFTAPSIPPTPNCAAINHGGTIPRGVTWHYKYSPVFPNGGEGWSSAPCEATTTAINSSIQISYSRYPGASGYNIYKSGDGIHFVLSGLAGCDLNPQTNSTGPVDTNDNLCGQSQPQFPAGGPAGLQGPMAWATILNLASAEPNSIVCTDKNKNIVTSNCPSVDSRDHRRVCDIQVDYDAPKESKTTRIGPRKRACYVPTEAAIVEIDMDADNGSSSLILGRRRAGRTLNIVSTALANGSPGKPACSNLSGGTGINGTTVCSATLQNVELITGDYIELVGGTTDGAISIMVHIIYDVH